jgi:pantetheine-phosphate adenylyltransferase
MDRLALYPGSFDPITYGHLDVLKRALNIFDHVELTVAVNAGKNAMFSLEERCEIARQSIVHLSDVTVVPFEGLLVNHARERGAVALIRGLRQVSDFDYEFRMAFANRRLLPEVETVFFMTSEEHAFVSASIVREISLWGGDLSTFVPQPVIDAVARRRQSHR